MAKNPYDPNDPNYDPNDPNYNQTDPTYAPPGNLGGFNRSPFPRTVASSSDGGWGSAPTYTPSPGDATIGPPPGSIQDPGILIPGAGGDPAGRTLPPNLTATGPGPQNSPQSPHPGTPDWLNDPQYSGMPSWLKDIYTSTGQTPAGQGTGFADWQYWSDKPSQADRLRSDILGTGSDQTTGTPWGAGAWQNSGGSGAGGGMGGGLASNLTIDPNQFQNDPYAQQVRDYILGALKEGSSPVTQDDPTVAPLIQALRGQQQRGQEDFARTSAERAYASGQPVSSGGYNSQQASFAQQANEGTQAGVSNVMSSMLNDRRNRLMTALNIGSNYLNAQQSRMLQAELANVTNALNNQHFYDQLGTNANIFAAGMNQNAVSPFLG